MKLVFFGTPEFAVPPLEALLAASDVAAVVTRPDKPRGRGLRVTPSAVAVAAAQYALELLQPASLRDPGLLERLRELSPDLFVVVAFGRLIPTELLGIASLGGINLHPSLLPHYRGAAPIPRAIAAGETGTGVTVLYVTPELDAGDIILQRPSPIRPDDTAGTLEARLAQEGAALLVDAIRLLEAGQVRPQPQDPSRVTFAPRLSREEGLIRWAAPAREIANAVRAFDPWPVGYTLREGAPLKIWRAVALPASVHEAPGTVLRSGNDGFVVAAGEGCLLIQEVQPASGRRMPAAAYVRGHPFAPGTVLGGAGGARRMQAGKGRR